MEGLNGNLGKLHNCGTSRPPLGQASSGLEGYMESFDIYLIGNIKSLRIPIPLLYSYGDLPIHSIFLIFCSLCFFPPLFLSFQVNYLLFFHKKTGSLQFWEQCPCQGPPGRVLFCDQVPFTRCPPQSRYVSLRGSPSTKRTQYLIKLSEVSEKWVT